MVDVAGFEDLPDRLVRFARAKLDDPAATVSGLVTMPGHAGFTFGFDTTSRGVTEAWFLRLPPPNVQWAGTADMVRQVTALEALDGSDVPHCAVRWWGGPDDVEWFGSPYFVVDRLGDGSVLGLEGQARWVLALDDATRRRMGRDAARALVGIHRVDWRARCAYLGDPVDLATDITSWDRLLGRVAEPDAFALAPRVRERLLHLRPAEPTIGLVHGDYQFGNLYYRADGTLRAVLDWELCAIGATLTDLGWFATWNDAAAWDHPFAVPEGMPSPEELVDDYAEAWGAPVGDVAFFRALAAYKFAVITGFNLALHRRGKRVDPLWEVMGASIGSLLARAADLLG